ncbi:hypothetical protein CROQUDRAFT_136104 [Cronartium quercuum f. sp. fusiforme G11]|uniref:Uncharacterized protein n=1 Tax=Cronartium quercuum f. sp. fusiforme G11 TaxID=708437 RepID=A0A9P6N9H7_9BASI|nr:hypothetical protein CROQUDRAFT_136104 [Cronartium quercuum f. sp. fusiforme G11]
MEDIKNNPIQSTSPNHQIPGPDRDSFMFNEGPKLELLNHEMIKYSSKESNNKVILAKCLLNQELVTIEAVRGCRGLSPNVTKFYISEIISTLHHLHLHSISFNKIDCEHVMLGMNGHLKLIN